ncbi:hypothetical protein ACWD25_16360 [Streptomyces sp. NPDC002920]
MSRVTAIRSMTGACGDRWSYRRSRALSPVTALGNSRDYQLVAVHSGMHVGVSEALALPGAQIHQWTCDSASALDSKRNQIWHLRGTT